MPRRTRRTAKQAEERSPLKRRIQVLWKNLVLFLILFIVSLVLFFLFAGNTLFSNLFEILFIVFGFISLAILIVLIVFMIIKSGRR